MNFEQEIHNQNNARRINILKGFSDFSEDLLQKSEEGSELEKGHMDFSNQRVYADNSVNRKLNRVGQKYGGRNVEDEKGVDKKDNSEESEDKNKPNPPQETQPNEQSQYSTEQLVEFASEAEDWQLQEFINDASKSGDNSEYMQAQINIAQDELNRRARPTSDIGEGADVDAEDLHNQENQENEDKSGLPDWNDVEGVKNFLRENPEVQSRFREIVEDDLTIRPIDAIKLALAETSSGKEALQTVEEAKNMLDELHAKLGGSNDSDEGSFEDFISKRVKEMEDSGENVFDEDGNILPDVEEKLEEEFSNEQQDFSRENSEDGANDDSNEENFVNTKELKIGESYKYVNPGFKDLNVEILNYPSEDTVSVKLLSDGEDGYKKGDVVDIQIEDISKGEGFIKTSDSNDAAEGIESNGKVSNEQHQLLAETFGDDGEDYKDANDFLAYARDNDDDGDFANLSDEEIKNWFETQKGAINGGESNPDNATEGIEGDEHHMMKVQRGKDKNK